MSQAGGGGKTDLGPTIRAPSHRGRGRPPPDLTPSIPLSHRTPAGRERGRAWAGPPWACPRGSHCNAVGGMRRSRDRALLVERYESTPASARRRSALRHLWSAPPPKVIHGSVSRGG